MEIDRKTLKALAADTRLDILKSLGKRRKMPSELAKELNLSTPTVVEHLGKLEEADLIRREETGHKWIYYSLTSRGSSLVTPKMPVNFILVFSISFILVFAGIMYTVYFSSAYTSGANVADRSADTGTLESAPMALKTISDESYTMGQDLAENETNVTNTTMAVP